MSAVVDMPRSSSTDTDTNTHKQTRLKHRRKYMQMHTEGFRSLAAAGIAEGYGGKGLRLSTRKQRGAVYSCMPESVWGRETVRDSMCARA